ncbi:putative metal-dependent protease of the PAD1/JAB1 superfamily [Gallibacterium anatis UMN179]|uniref:Putative metal-dependent protease of the PAD1/JAB1 superfamily n=1 Tax=Gallibacterium anatis (strain UMN179) TaxID=1005058 RepID=F4HFN4_GALAU|nr:Mov34/MPN/PAD-1 family protein [Gallibacterium anatis]AEC17075.1 putative metal-dependent protease of the PAD1/JAB1 superfamily [Gallibacterium anatis UMN179]KGQ32046.1 peptidase [Gallibacterium anatis]
MIVKKYKNLQLCVECTLIELMANLAIHHYPNEYGGFLLGCYSDNLTKLYIKDFLLIDKYDNSPVEFKRELNLKVHNFEKIFRETGLYYIGEWHSHPNATAWYSSTDLQAMQNIASCNTVQLKNPVLSILSISSNKLLDFNFFLFDEGRLVIYE